MSKLAATATAEPAISSNVLAPADIPNKTADDVVEIANNLGLIEIGPRTVKYAVLEGRLTAHRVAGKLRFSDADIAAWIRGMREPDRGRVEIDTASPREAARCGKSQRAKVGA